MKEKYKQVKICSNNREKRVRSWDDIDYKECSFYHTKLSQSLRKNGTNKQYITHLFDIYTELELQDELNDIVENYIAANCYEDDVIALAKRNQNEYIYIKGLIGIYSGPIDNDGYNVYSDITASRIEIKIPRGKLSLAYKDKWVSEKDALTGNVKNRLMSQVYFSVDDIEYSIYNYNKESLHILNYVKSWSKGWAVSKNEIVLKLEIVQ